MEIQVNETHIETGVINNPWGCMVYKALADSNLEVNSVLYETLSFDDGSARKIGPNLQEKIQQFDNGEKLTPFTFELTSKIAELV